MGVPVTTPTGEWISKAVRTLEYAQAALDREAKYLEILAKESNGADWGALRKIAAELRAIAVRLRQEAAPF